MRWLRALQGQRPLPHLMGEVPAGRRGMASVEVPVRMRIAQAASIDYDVVERLRPVPLRPYRATSPIRWGRNKIPESSAILISPSFPRAILCAAGES